MKSDVGFAWTDLQQMRQQLEKSLILVQNSLLASIANFSNREDWWYRGASRIRNFNPPRTTTGPQA